jgi:hypothetical protein
VKGKRINFELEKRKKAKDRSKTYHERSVASTVDGLRLGHSHGTESAAVV